VDGLRNVDYRWGGMGGLGGEEHGAFMQRQEKQGRSRNSATVGGRGEGGMGRDTGGPGTLQE
jgi:hypothetical protein